MNYKTEIVENKHGRFFVMTKNGYRFTLLLAYNEALEISTAINSFDDRLKKFKEI
jgi:hypothetical protein|tara:strand:+ start:731 stop:895 length:165 start_codon:yes stop_codon:yes gene_type:complete